ncbi:MrpH family fimbial adhesin [Serratia marcescens]|uniref:MrpH family fimbial adhesin n=1 Tax=Serratia marcescens TaxID=615 RepID=UPI003FA7A678
MNEQPARLIKNSATGERLKKFCAAACILFAMSYFPSGRAEIMQDHLYSYNGFNWTIYGAIYDWFGPDSTPNPCYQRSCDLGLQAYEFNTITGTRIRPLGAAQYFAFSPSGLSAARDVGEAGKSVRGALPVQYLLWQSATGINNPNTLTITCLVYRSGGTAQVYAETCMSGNSAPPSTPVWCKPKSGNISLNHGTLNGEEVDGKTRAASYVVWCNRDVTAKIYAKNLIDSRLYLRNDNSLYADLTIDDRPLSTGITQVFKEGIDYRFIIKSVLGHSGNGVEAGAFRGSTVIYVDIQ